MDSLISNDEQVVGRKGNIHLPSCDPSAPSSETWTGEENGEVYVPSHFSEKSIVLSVIEELSLEYANGNPMDVSVLRLRLVPIMRMIEKYREDPCLLDPHVSALVRPIFECVLLPHVQSRDTWSSQLSFFSALVYVISTVVGQRTLTQSENFPHQVTYIPYVLWHVENLHVEFWESRYVLTLWLSVLVMAPFDFTVMGLFDLPERIYSVATIGLSHNKSVSKASSLLLGRFLCRKDTNFILSRFVSSPVSAGFLEGLYRVVKLSPFLSPEVLSAVFSRLLERAEPGTDKRQLILCLGELTRFAHPVHSLAWIEDSLNTIISHFGDKQSCVREAVAKNLGKILSRLPRIYMRQLSLFLVAFEPETDYEVHTKVLLMGELARRQMHVAECVDVAAESLTKERSVLRTAVKDAGCAIVWFLSRVVPRDELFAAVGERVFPSLVNCALFERDINLRRAAAAALQELAGRVGSLIWPDGLAAVGLIDFWSVASVTETFTVVAPNVAQKIPHLQPILVAHLLEEKLFVPDPKWIALASRALARLVDGDEGNALLVSLGEEATLPATEWYRRLATVTCLGEILAVNVSKLPESTQTLVRNIVPLIDKRRLFRGKGGDLIRVACNKLLASIWRSVRSKNITVKDEERFMRKSIELLREGIVHLVDHVQVAAVVASRLVVESTDAGLLDELLFLPFRESVETERNINIAARRGMLLTLALLDCSSCRTISLMEREATSWPKHWSTNQDFVDPISRKFACLGLVLGGSSVPTLLECLSDFQTDKRGDVGSWVRQIAMDGLLMAREAEGDLIERKLISHAGERLDRVRLQVFSGISGIRQVSRDSLVQSIIGVDPGTTSLQDGEIAESAVGTVASGFVESAVGTVALGAFDLICETIEKHRNDRSVISDLMSQYVTTVGGVTSQAVSAEAEKALISVCDRIGAGSVVDGLIELLSRPGGRWQSASDRIHRLFIPTINTVAIIVSRFPDALPVETMLGVHKAVIVPTLASSCSAITDYNRQKCVVRLYSSFWLESTEILEFTLNAVVNSGMPKLRYSFAQDFLAVLSKSNIGYADELIDLIDATDWLSEIEDLWLPGIIDLGARLGAAVEPERLTIDPSKERRIKPTPDYADFVKEVHRYS